MLVPDSAESSEAQPLGEAFCALPVTICPPWREEARGLGRLRSLPLQGQSSSGGGTRLCCPVKTPAGQMPAQNAALPSVLHMGVHVLSWQGTVEFQHLLPSADAQMYGSMCLCWSVTSSAGHRWPQGPYLHKWVPFRHSRLRCLWRGAVSRQGALDEVLHPCKPR